MDQNINKIISDRFANLPKEIQKVITESNFLAILKAISEENHLMIDQGAMLEREVLMILLGMDELGNLENNLVREVGVPAETASTITIDVKKKIFTEILDFFIQKENDRDDENLITTPLNTGLNIASRENILEGIENPTPSNNRVAVSEVNKTTEQKGSTLPTPNIAVANPNKGLIASKLSQTVVTPTEKIKNESKIPNGDPYREIPLV